MPLALPTRSSWCIDSVRVYDTALAQDVLEAETYIEKDSGIIRQENVFSFEDWNTEGIRI